MMFHPRIIHKGIALALVPLAVNTVFIGLLSWSLTRAKDLVNQEHHQTVVLTHMDRINVLIVSSFGAILTFASTGSEHFKEKAEEINLQARKEFATLGRLTVGDTDVHQWLKELNATLDEDTRMLAALDQGVEEETDILKRVKKMRGLVRLVGKKNNLLMKIMDEKLAQLSVIREQEKGAEEFVRAVVLCGLISNFAIALILILLFVRDITNRLRVLVDNAHMLPRQIPLTASVSGHDELSELDEVIHEASAQLIESAEYRRGLMQMMAHDLRSPLTASLVSLEMLIERLPADAGVEKQTESINLSLKTSVDLINDLLLLESLEVGQLVLGVAPENLRELVETASLTVSSLAAMKKIKINNDADKEYVIVDRNRILQVLTNLISNAIKFSPSAGTIRIVSTTRENEVEVSVIDQGKGLTAIDKAKLFQKFQQTSEGKLAGGTGLGLAISKLIVESHGGEIGVDSELGHGAQFWFTIPVVQQLDAE